MSAHTCDQTIPYIPTIWFNKNNIGILNTAHRITPRDSDLFPSPNPWNTYTVKKLINISGVARHLILRKSVPNSTVCCSGMNIRIMLPAKISYSAILVMLTMIPTLMENFMI